MTYSFLLRIALLVMPCLMWSTKIRGCSASNGQFQKQNGSRILKKPFLHCEDPGSLHFEVLSENRSCAGSGSLGWLSISCLKTYRKPIHQFFVSSSTR